jgi:hypothetical protein
MTIKRKPQENMAPYFLRNGHHQPTDGPYFASPAISASDQT